ncbi:MAG: nucleotidyl transferase AbiEii/AbiGii toxin family protein [Chloroflexi bacterium]|nr:nucleotidyl transferase AbiEii/AbiGii toxin family protein [Chloroflexota bacterium]
MKTFAPRLDILPPAQRSLWPDLADVPTRFVLYGGTAIALRLGHRQSLDFDFFSSEPFDPDQLFEAFPELRRGRRLQSKTNTLTVELERGQAVGLSFFGGLTLGRVGAPEQASGPQVTVASLLDLAALKVAVIQERALCKDYWDVAALLQAGIKLPEALGAAGALYGRMFNPMITLKALNYFADGDLPKLPGDVKQFLSEQASQVKTIPVIPRLSDRIAAEP